MAIASATKETLCIYQLMFDLKLIIQCPIQLMYDNQSCIDWCKIQSSMKDLNT